jgi:hypothetical protein
LTIAPFETDHHTLRVPSSSQPGIMQRDAVAGDHTFGPKRTCPAVVAAKTTGRIE